MKGANGVLTGGFSTVVLAGVLFLAFGVLSGVSGSDNDYSGCAGTCNNCVPRLRTCVSGTSNSPCDRQEFTQCNRCVCVNVATLPEMECVCELEPEPDPD